MAFFDSIDNNDNDYNPRMHSKVAERAGFSVSANEQPRTLYVGNLDSSVTEEFIGTLFGQIGVVSKTKVVFDGTNDPYAFVEFADHHMAAQALQTMNRRMLLDKEMKVNWAVEPGQQQVKVDTSRHFHVFVGDLSAEVDNKALKDAFAPFGDVSDAKVIRDIGTLKSKGYGFVSYPKREEAERAIEQMNGQWLGRRTIRTNWATRKPGQGGGAVAGNDQHQEKSFDDIYNSTTPDNTSVYVGNIGQAASEETIRTAFERFGRIVEVRIFKAQGYAFVKFDAKNSACRAIQQMSGSEVGGQTVRCSWGKVNATSTGAPGGFGAAAAGATGAAAGTGAAAATYGYGGAYGGYGTPGATSTPGAYGAGAGAAPAPSRVPAAAAPPAVPSAPPAVPASGAASAGAAAAAQQQYWQYYAQYYNNPQMMQQWANYWQQQGAGGAPPAAQK